MEETEIRNFIFLACLMLLVFTSGMAVFIFQYYRRKVLYEREKALLNEQHLEDLLNSKLEIQEQTMQDIGREIHDNVGQKLTLASIYSHQVAYENQLPQQIERITEIGKIIDESLSELRSLSKNLTNPHADIAELKELIQNECKRVNALNICKMQCNFGSGDFLISNTIKNFILRIVQEFLQNSLKHANCKNIKLDFGHTEKGIFITIEDDGKGFEVAAQVAITTAGIGLSNMRKRAELIGAEFSLSSVLNAGTVLELFIPLAKTNVL